MWTGVWNLPVVNLWVDALLEGGVRPRAWSLPAVDIWVDVYLEARTQPGAWNLHIMGKREEWFGSPSMLCVVRLKRGSWSPRISRIMIPIHRRIWVEFLWHEKVCERGVAGCSLRLGYGCRPGPPILRFYQELHGTLP